MGRAVLNEGQEEDIGEDSDEEEEDGEEREDQKSVSNEEEGRFLFVRHFEVPQAENFAARQRSLDF